MAGKPDSLSTIAGTATPSSLLADDVGVAGMAGELLDLVHEVVAGERGAGVVDAVPRRRRFDGRRRRVGGGDGREVLGAGRVELGDGAGRGLIVRQCEAGLVRRERRFVDLGPLADPPVSRAVAPRMP